MGEVNPGTPTFSPYTESPTRTPTKAPTAAPTAHPTNRPSASPSFEGTAHPSVDEYTTAPTGDDTPYIIIQNNKCESYMSGNCTSFDEVWNMCAGHKHACKGIQWSSCDTPGSILGTGKWGLIYARTDVRDADNPTTHCGGKDEAQGEWDIYLKVRWQHQPNQLCTYTLETSDNCFPQDNWEDVSRKCEGFGLNCYGINWQNCDSNLPTKTRSGLGRWKMLSRTQAANLPCDYSSDWSLFVKNY